MSVSASWNASFNMPGGLLGGGAASRLAMRRSLERFVLVLQGRCAAAVVVVAVAVAGDEARALPVWLDRQPGPPLPAPVVVTAAAAALDVATRRSSGGTALR